jgi:hypothetical protein
MVSCFWKCNGGIREFSSIEKKSRHTTTRVVYVIGNTKCTRTPGVWTSCAALGATLELAMKNQMSSESQGRVAYFSKKNTTLKYKNVTSSDALTTLCHPLCPRRPIAQHDCFASCRPLRRWRFPSPLGRCLEYHTLSGRRQEYDALGTR